VSLFLAIKILNHNEKHFSQCKNSRVILVIVSSTLLIPLSLSSVFIFLSPNKGDEKIIKNHLTLCCVLFKKDQRKTSPCLEMKETIDL